MIPQFTHVTKSTKPSPKINEIQERALRFKCQEYESSYEVLMEKDRSIRSVPEKTAASQDPKVENQK